MKKCILYDKCNTLVDIKLYTYYKESKQENYDYLSKIDYCVEMLGFIEEKYPELINYCKVKICCEAIYLMSKVEDRNDRKYLFEYVKLFRKYDTDSDGILNESEFVNLIRNIPYCKDNADEYSFKFLSIIDPFNNKKITFSECVSLFSMEMIDEPDGKGQTSLLDKVCLEDMGGSTNNLQ